MSLIDIATIVRNGSHPSVEDGRTPWANEKSTGVWRGSGNRQVQIATLRLAIPWPEKKPED
jgi:hypothetical protein